MKWGVILAAGLIGMAGLFAAGCADKTKKDDFPDIDHMLDGDGYEFPDIDHMLDGDGYDMKYSDDMQALQKIEIPLGMLLECYVSDSGNEFGSIDRKSLARGDDGSVYLTVESSDTSSDPITVSVYRADDNAMEQALEIIKEYNFPAWSDLPEGDEIMLDGPTHHIGMYFDNESVGGGSYDSYGFDMTAQLPPDGNQAVQKFENCLFQWISDDRLVEQRTENR